VVKLRRLICVVAAPLLMLVITGAFSAVATNVASAAPHFGNTFGPKFDRPLPPSAARGGWFDDVYNCRGGDVPPGTYTWVVITGQCYAPVGTVTVRHDLTVAPGALLDAVTPGDPAAGPVVPATVFIGGNVFVGPGAVLLFGCSPNISCSSPPGITNDRIGGNITGWGALGIVVHSTSIGGSVSVVGGGGGVNCNTTPPTPPSVATAPVPWSEDASLDNTPVYTDFEDNSIGGNLNISGLQSCWLGSLREQVGGSVSISNNTLADPDAVEVGSNLISGNMNCFGNSAGGVSTVQYGDSGASPNLVGGWASGQCGFNVQVLNPAPEALAQESPPQTCTSTTCIPEHISVSTRALGTYYGTHTQVGPSLDTLSLGVTQSGNTLGAELNNVVFAGSGLTGAVTAVYPPTTADPLGSTGETVITTDHQDGSGSFQADDVCASCTFDGQSGSTSIRAYGTVSPNGVITGTFLVTSGGAPDGGLATLAGYGTFSSWGQPAGTLGLVEHLKIT
jgi:hypothetical protein